MAFKLLLAARRDDHISHLRRQEAAQPPHAVFPETRTTFLRTRPGYRSVFQDRRFLLTDSVRSFGEIRERQSNRTMARASICIICVTGLAAVLAVIATGISTGWQREHRTSQLREVRPFERGLSIPSRLASAQVSP
jgi:hypothetical protein